jgi:hypothetical protein
MTGIETASASARVASDIEALEHAVAGDVGVDDRGDAGVLEALAEFGGRQFDGSRPAFDRDHCPSRASMPTAMRPGLSRAASRTKFGIAHRRRADDDARDALAEPAFDGAHVADAAAELHRHASRRAGCASTARAFTGLAGEGAVEIDDMQIFEALRLEGARLRAGSC